MTRNLLKNSCTSVLVAVISVVVLVAAGCKKKDTAPLPPSPSNVPTQQVKPVAKPVQKSVSSVVKLPAVTSNQFDFSTKKDPFKPYVVIKEAPTATSAEMKKSVLPIHSYDVSQFRLIGVVTGAKSSQAMVVDPGGKGYVLKLGMTIGKNNGRVTEISASGVEILEQFKDDNGRVRKERIRIALPRKQ